MSNIVLFLVCLCAGLDLGRRRFLPAEVPMVLDRSVAFDALPGLILLRCHDIHLRRAVVVPVGTPSCGTVAGRHGKLEIV